MALALAMLSLRLWQRIVAVLILLALSLGICHWAHGFLAAGDATAIVADEYLTFPLAALALAGFRRPGVGLVALFVVSRVLDSLKPAPALLAGSLPGGAGIVADDLIANLYAALLAVSLRRLWRWLR
jgi:phosphatidylglycerophosphatase A